MLQRTIHFQFCTVSQIGKYHFQNMEDLRFCQMIEICCHLQILSRTLSSAVRFHPVQENELALCGLECPRKVYATMRKLCGTEKEMANQMADRRESLRQKQFAQ